MAQKIYILFIGYLLFCFCIKGNEERLILVENWVWYTNTVRVIANEWAYNFSIEEKSTILDLKQKIENKMKIPIDQQMFTIINAQYMNSVDLKIEKKYEVELSDTVCIKALMNGYSENNFWMRFADRRMMSEKLGDK